MHFSALANQLFTNGSIEFNMKVFFSNVVRLSKLSNKFFLTIHFLWANI